MNRRIPDGMYGGVGGRRLITCSYPIYISYQQNNSLPKSKLYLHRYG
jgi:hypothetical protein